MSRKRGYSKIDDDKSLSQQDDELPLHAINKRLLDFDLEFICSSSLATTNIYCCLKCGKFFQGRSKNSPAYNHSVDEIDHILHIKLETLNVYRLPDNIEVDSKREVSILNDIRNCVNPKYTIDNITKLHNIKSVFASDIVNRNQYLIGFLGLNVVNNDSKNNFQGVILQLLAHIPDIRDWYLINTSDENEIYTSFRQELKYANNLDLNLKFGLFIRRYWYDKLLKPQISPFDLLNYINKISKGMFLKKSVDNSDPKTFLNWILNNLSLGIRKDKTKEDNIINNNIQGKIKVQELEKENVSDNESKKKSSTTKFWQVTLKLPDKKILTNQDVPVEQISLNQLIHDKFRKPTIISDTKYKKYALADLPKYLIINFDRFNKNFRHNFNDIVIKFDPDHLDLSQYHSDKENAHYKLITNVVHQTIDNLTGDNLLEKSEGIFSSDRHAWKIQLLNQKSSEWYEIDNLQIKKINKTLMFLEETYIQVYERV